MLRMQVPVLTCRSPWLSCVGRSNEVAADTRRGKIRKALSSNVERRNDRFERIELFSDMSGLCGRACKRDGDVERLPCFVATPELLKERAVNPVEIEVVGEPLFKRLDKIECLFRARCLEHSDGPVERDDGGGCHAFKRLVEEADLRPVGHVGGMRLGVKR